MQAEQLQLARAIIRALVDDWALVEDTDDDEHLVLVDENRDEMEGLQPRRDFVAWLEAEGYIKNTGVPLDAEPEYMEYKHWHLGGGLEVRSMRAPHVFDYSPTPEGLALLSDDNAAV